MGRFGVRLHDWRPARRSVARYARQRRVRLARGGDRSGVHVGRRSPAAHAVAQDGHLRDAREGVQQAASERARAAARHLRGAHDRGGDRAPAAARRHRRRADARAPPRLRSAPGRARPVELLGLQHAGVLRARHPVCLVGIARAVRPRVQADGEGAAQRGARGDPGRGLQPHRGREPSRADAVAARRGQPVVLPARARRHAVLPGLHRLRQHAEHAQPAGAAAHHGQPAVLGPRHARRRLPVRPREHARARAVRGRSARRVLRHRPPGSRAVAGEADRGALGPRRGRLPGRQLSGAVDRVERQVSRRDARVLAGRRPRRRRGRDAHRGEQRPVRAQRAPPVREHQLHHVARRVHAAGPGLLQPEAQRRQRRRQPGWRELEPELELRRRGTDEGPAHPQAPGTAEAQPDGVTPAFGRRSDDQRRRRDGTEPVREQQRLLPGQRAELDELEPDARAARLPDVHAAPRAFPPFAADADAPQVLPGALDSRGRGQGHLLARPERPRDDRHRVERAVRAVARRADGRQRHRRDRRARAARVRRHAASPAQRALRVGAVRAAGG